MESKTNYIAITNPLANTSVPGQAEQSHVTTSAALDGFSPNTMTDNGARQSGSDDESEATSDETQEGDKSPLARMSSNLVGGLGTSQTCVPIVQQSAGSSTDLAMSEFDAVLEKVNSVEHSLVRSNSSQETIADLASTKHVTVASGNTFDNEPIYELLHDNSIVGFARDTSLPQDKFHWMANDPEEHRILTLVEVLPGAHQAYLPNSDPVEEWVMLGEVTSGSLIQWKRTQCTVSSEYHYDTAEGNLAVDSSGAQQKVKLSPARHLSVSSRTLTDDITDAPSCSGPSQIEVNFSSVGKRTAPCRISSTKRSLRRNSKNVALPTHSRQRLKVKQPGIRSI